MSELCVVTGGAGFIGSHLCEALLGRGYSVLCVDNLLTGSESNIAHLKTNPDFRFLKYDIREPLAIDDDVAYVFHLASPASVIDYQEYPEETAFANSLGTYQLLQFAEKKHAKFLFTSTSEVYGDPRQHPQKETYWGNVNPIGVRSCYDESKRFGEMMVMLFVRRHGVDARIVRIFNTYGPRMRKTDGRVISNFINQALEGKSLTVYGEGAQTRSFCYVSDLIEGIQKAMFTDKTKGEVINLGNPEEYQVIDLAKKIKEMIGSSSEVVFETLPQDDPEVRQPNITKARDLLGWSPTIQLHEGLAKTIEYYKSI